MDYTIVASLIVSVPAKDDKMSDISSKSRETWQSKPMVNQII